MDHETKDIYLVALHEKQGSAIEAADAWLVKTEGSLKALQDIMSEGQQRAASLPQKVSVERICSPHQETVTGVNIYP